MSYDYSKIQKVFGTEWKPSPTFTPEIQSQGYYGAVRVAGTPEVYGLGAGTPEHLSAEKYALLFGGANQTGIVGEITPQQAAALGIPGYAVSAPISTPAQVSTPTSLSTPTTTPTGQKPYIRNPLTNDVYDRQGNHITAEQAAQIPNFWSMVEITSSAPATGGNLPGASETVQEGDIRINPTTGLEEVYTPEGIWAPKSASVVGTSDGVTEPKTKSDIELLTEKATSLTLQQQIKSLETDLGIGKAPVVPTLANDFQALRSEYGIPALEQRLTDIKAQIRAVEDSMTAGLYDEEGRLAPMEVITGRQDEIKKQAAVTLSGLQRSEALLVDELNTKGSMISTLMTLKQQDYSNASAAYNAEFTKQINLLNIIYGREDQEAQMANQVQDDARANLNILMTAYQGSDWSSIDETTKSLMNTLSVKAGIPTGLVPAIFSAVDKTKEMSFHVISDDQTTVSIFYKDGSSETFSTGLPAKAASGGGITLVQFTSDEFQKLTGVGLSADQINTLKSQVNSSGLDAALKSGQYSDAQAGVIKTIFGKKEYLNEDYFKNAYTTDELKAAAKAKGFTSGGFLGFGVGEQGVADYLTYMMNTISTMRTQGNNDDDIKKFLGLR